MDTTQIPNDKEIALIVGGTQGIGFALVKNLLEGKSASFFPSDGLVIATARDPKSPLLIELQKQYPKRLFIELVDVQHENSIEDFIQVMNTKYPRVDLYIHNSGVVLDDKTSQTSGKLDTKAYMTTHMINVLAPSAIFYGLAPLLDRTHLLKSGGLPSQLNKRPQPLSSDPKKDTTTFVRVLFISSIMGSMELHTFFSAPIYRTSKAALNHVVKDMALTKRHLSINVMHPGYVTTTLTGGNGNIGPDESADGILSQLSIEGYSINNMKSILSYDGNHLPW